MIEAAVAEALEKARQEATLAKEKLSKQAQIEKDF